MATPSKAVQFRDVDSVVQMYINMKVPAFGVKQNSALNFKYQGDDLEEGGQQLRNFLDMLQDSESAAIYTLAIYEQPGDRITEKTPVDLSWNFRLRDAPAGMAGMEMYGGGYGAMMNEIRQLKGQVAALQTKKEEEPENKLGLIGEIMEMDAMAPIMMAVGNRIADLLAPPAKVGELKRVSGIPGLLKPWKEDEVITDALDRLSKKVDDLPAILQKLADMADNSPTKFSWYIKAFRTMA